MKRKKLVVLTGAGMSAESGIRTFRDSGGLWEENDVMEVCSTQGWAKNKALVLEFYNQRRKQLLTAKPNAGHTRLSELEELFDVHIITQNVDNLHEKAGSSQVLHLHGELMKVRSTLDESKIYSLNENNWEVNVGDKAEDGAQLRPHIVFFGEAVPAMDQAIPICESADFFAIIGTSMNVYPAAGLIHYIPKSTPVYVIDPNPVEIAVPNPIEHLNTSAVNGVPLFIKKITS